MGRPRSRYGPPSGATGMPGGAGGGGASGSIASVNPFGATPGTGYFFNEGSASKTRLRSCSLRTTSGAGALTGRTVFLEDRLFAAMGNTFKRKGEGRARTSREGSEGRRAKGDGRRAKSKEAGVEPAHAPNVHVERFFLRSRIS